jgi:hypothetical protein
VLGKGVLAPPCASDDDDDELLGAEVVFAAGVAGVLGKGVLASDDDDDELLGAEVVFAAAESGAASASDDDDDELLGTEVVFAAAESGAASASDDDDDELLGAEVVFAAAESDAASKSNAAWVLSSIWFCSAADEPLMMPDFNELMTLRKGASIFCAILYACRQFQEVTGLLANRVRKASAWCTVAGVPLTR